MQHKFDSRKFEQTRNIPLKAVDTLGDEFLNALVYVLNSFSSDGEKHRKGGGRETKKEAEEERRREHR